MRLEWRMNASDKATLKKNFGGRKPSSKLILKTKWYWSFGCCDDSRIWEQLKKCVTDKYFEKYWLWTLITFCSRKRMLPLEHLIEWSLQGVYVWQKFLKKNISNWVIIWIKFEVLWLFKCSAVLCFGFFWTPAAKATCLQDLAGCFRRRLSPEAQSRVFVKNGSCIQILDATLLYYMICSKDWRSCGMMGHYR